METINNRNELLAITGGLDISGAIINACTGGIKVIMDVGRSLGTAIRRITLGSLCKI